jgi:hypothetical protein
LYGPNFNLTTSSTYHSTLHASFFLIPFRKDHLSTKTSILPTETALSIVIRNPSQASSMLRCHRGKCRNRGSSLTLKRHLFPRTPTPLFFSSARKERKLVAKRRRKEGSKGNSFTREKGAHKSQLARTGDTVVSHPS